VTDFTALSTRSTGTLLLPGDDGFAAAVGGFNTAVHHAPEALWVAQTADDVVVINRGKSVAQAPLNEIMARSGGGMKVAGPDVRKLGDILYQQGANVSGDTAEILVKDRTGEQIGRIVAEHQLVISELAPVGSSLEEVYLELTGSTGGPS